MIQILPPFINDTLRSSQWQLWLKPSSLIQSESPNVVSSPSEPDTLTLVLHKMQEIADYGIGYSDAIGYVAFPLIIALFAFAFPFLFSAINDINKRYESKSISHLFEKSLAYRAFMWISGVSVLYVVVFAGLSLSKNFVLEDFLRSYGMVTSIIMAGLYAATVLCFVKKCIAYNKPTHLIDEIKSAHKIAQRWILVRLFLQKYKNWFVGLFHGGGYKEFSGFGYRLNKSGLAYSVDSVFVEQLADLTKFALDTNDTGLVYLIFDAMDAIIEKEKEAINNGWCRKKTVVDYSNSHRLTFLYYEQILESSNSRWNEQIEEFLVWKLLGAFSKSKYMNPVDIYFLFKYLQKLQTCGRFSLINKYIDKSKYYFSYLSDIVDVAYVKGADGEDLKNVKSECYENWCELRDYHFLVAAYWIAEGEYRLLPELLHDQSYKSIYLYPVYAEDILYRYQQCKKRVSADGRYFDYKTTDDLFGKKLDINVILDRYTAILLLLCHEGEKLSRQGAKEDEINEIVKAKTCISKYVSALKVDSELRRLKTDVHNVDFDNVFAEGLKCLTDYYPKQKPKWWCPLSKYNPFIQPLDSDAKLQMKNLFVEALQYRLKSLQGYWGEIEDGKEKYIVVKPFKTHFIKDVLIKHTEDAKCDFFAVSSRLDVVEGRLMHLFLEYVDSTTINRKIIKNYDLKDFVTGYLKGHEKEYILLDIGDYNNVLLEPRCDGHEQYFNEGTLYLRMDDARYSHLAGSSLYEKYKRSILIIHKEDLPSLKLTDLSINYEDISSEKDGVYAVELTIDPGVAFCYSKDVEIMCVNSVR